MFILYCACANPKVFGILEIGAIANSIIAIFTFILGFYVFIYKRRKDKKSIKLQWFKELIVLPNINEVYKFYDSLRSLREKITTDNLSEELKIELINFIKEVQSYFRKSFVDSLQIITPELYKSVMINLDNLTDSLTNSISNDELKLSNQKTFDKEINSKIQYSFNDLFSEIFNYKG